jgi:ATP-dependent DNA helicase RecG
MQDTELEALLTDLESDRVERKEALSDHDRIREVICAFANDLPNHRQRGVLFVGVRDDGSPANLQITDDLLVKLSGFAREGNILPMPSMTVEKRRLRGADVAVIIVAPAEAPPVRLRGRVWIRSGPRRAVATPEEERRLSERRRGRDLPFDIQPMPSAALADLDMGLFKNAYLPAAVDPEILAQNQRSDAHKLASLRFATSDPEPVPTVLGLLTVGKSPRDFVPGAYLQFLRFDGLRLTDPMKSEKEIDGPLDLVLRRLDEVLEANVSTSVSISGQSTERRAQDFPLEALRQLARNAVMHRTYEGTNAPIRIHWFDDRVEVQSPGGPFGLVNRANFGSPGVTDYRNPNLAGALRNLGYVQRFGVGIQIARDELRKNGSPSLEFQVEETQVLAVVRRRA